MCSCIWAQAITNLKIVLTHYGKLSSATYKHWFHWRGHAYLHVNTQAHAHIHAITRIYTQTRTNAHARIMHPQALAHARTHSHIHILARADKHTHMHAHTSRKHICTQTNTHACTHTHTCTQHHARTHTHTGTHRSEQSITLTASLSTVLHLMRYRISLPLSWHFWTVASAFCCVTCSPVIWGRTKKDLYEPNQKREDKRRIVEKNRQEKKRRILWRGHENES